MANTLESALASDWGVPRDVLKKTRAKKLAAETDWRMGAGGIEITAAGRKKMRALLDLPAELEPVDGPQAGAGLLALPWQENDLVARAHNGYLEAKGKLQRHHTLIVVKLGGNRISLLCSTERGEIVTLRVKDNSHFTLGMKVQTCVHVRGSQYDYEGRLPRRKGKF